VSIDIQPTELAAIRDWRERYRHEMRCQIVHDSYHARGFTTLYRLRIDGRDAGYGALSGDDRRDTVKEFFVVPELRGRALPLLDALIAAAGARWVECQTNDRLLSTLLYDVAEDFRSDVILFADALDTALAPPDARAAVRPLSSGERSGAFAHTTVPVGEWGVVVDGEVVATGGFLTHYNPPFADVYMEVATAARRRGFGSHLVQEVKRACYAAGLVPAARCNAENVASRRTLQRAGMMPVGRIVRGRVLDRPAAPV
jgi:GNAT superfamily N-acetyltransferase